jgi:hypothetical protein
MADAVYLEQDTQFRYTPDAGTVRGPCHCGVCRTQMSEKRAVNGPRGFAEAMGRHSSTHDVFECPHGSELWHQQVVALRTAADKTPSGKLAEMFRTEAIEIVGSREATVERISRW